MKKRRNLYLLIAALAITALSFALTIEANVPDNDANGEKRADIIIINTLKSFGELERKEVPFLHDAHTEALKKIDISCDSCHPSKDVLGTEGLSLKFKRLEDTDRQEVMNIYHDGCIGCHKELEGTDKKIGPAELCGECHKESEYVSSGQPMDFDKSLHSQHIEINDEDCSVCHHVGKKEGSCRYCHRDNGKKEPVSMKSASHLSCIGCHRELSGPVKCSACHSPEEVLKIETLADVPRLQMEQPDFMLIGTIGGGKSTAGIAPVPFDHMAHEESQDTCRICHHAEIGSCTNSCHTTAGSNKGDMITSEQAMHKIDSEQSCIGCHEIKKRQANCAGCHGFMEKGVYENNACLKCHMEIPAADVEENMERESIAAMLLESAGAEPETVEEKDVPELITIDGLSFQYGAVKFSHRKHVESLMLDIKDNDLAGFFHNGKQTVCLGCHHNSPAGDNPPECASCHSESPDEAEPLRPDLKVAYHQQCMGCHDRMGIEKPESTSCNECHKVIGVNKLL